MHSHQYCKVCVLAKCFSYYDGKPVYADVYYAVNYQITMNHDQKIDHKMSMTMKTISIRWNVPSRFILDI